MLAEVMSCLPSSAYNSIFVLLRYEDDHYMQIQAALRDLNEKWEHREIKGLCGLRKREVGWSDDALNLNH